MTIMPHPEEEYEAQEMRVYWHPKATRPAFRHVEDWQHPGYHHRRHEYMPPEPAHAHPQSYPYVPSLHPPPAPRAPPPMTPPTMSYYHPPTHTSYPAPPPVVYVPPTHQYHHHKDHDVIQEVRDEDVLCGRGAPSSWHNGNRQFRQVVSYYQPAYLAARRADKPDIAMRIVHDILGRGGRFLKRTKMHGAGPSGHFCWQDIGESRAYEKVCQALREGAPEMRRQMLAAKEGKTRRAAAIVDSGIAVIEPSGKDGRDDE
jgi:hypothetical protein